MAEKFFWQRGKDDAKKVSGEPIEEINRGVAHDEERDRAQAENLAVSRRGWPSLRVNAIGRGAGRHLGVGWTRPLSGPAWKSAGLEINPTRNITRGARSNVRSHRFGGRYRLRRSNADGRRGTARRTPRADRQRSCRSVFTLPRHRECPPFHPFCGVGRRREETQCQAPDRGGSHHWLTFGEIRRATRSGARPDRSVGQGRFSSALSCSPVSAPRHGSVLPGPNNNSDGRLRRARRSPNRLRPRSALWINSTAGAAASH